MHPGHLLIVALVLGSLVSCALALVWAWRTSDTVDQSILMEFVRRDRQDPEAARRWLRETLGTERGSPADSDASRPHAP